MLTLNDICKNIVGEELESIIEKAHCDILFTSNYVIKIFGKDKGDYNRDILMNEYIWDKKMPFLSAYIKENINVGGVYKTVLVLKRIPYYANLLYKLTHSDINNDQIIRIGQLVKKLIYSYPADKIGVDIIYKNFISNLDKQIQYLDDKISPKLLTLVYEFRNRTDLMQFFLKVGQIDNVVTVHGNLFSGNIFYLNEKLIVIDPISNNHIAKKSFRHIDLATFFVDIILFNKGICFEKIFSCLTDNMEYYEIILIRLYMVLKLLVRLRFAYMEQGLLDEYSDLNVNLVIISRAEVFIKREITSVLRLVKKI